MRRFQTGAVVLVLVGWICLPRPALREGVPLSKAVYDRKGNLLRLTVASDGRYRFWIPLESFPMELRTATVLYEDRWFRYHPGVNPVSIVRAAWTTYVRHARRVGGSTITMQLARMRYGLNTRGIRGKLVQIGAALWIEATQSKDTILEAYLNLAPYGGNIVGAGAAARLYFGVDAADMTEAQCLALALIPQNPTQRAPPVARVPPAVRAALLSRWGNPNGKIATLKRGVSPFLAPHFSDAVLADDRHRGGSLRTTLDPALQSILEERLSAALGPRASEGLRNAAAMLIDWRSREVLAAVGSASYFDPEIDGNVIGFRAPRSPGSTLKPFVYALAFDAGLAHPATVLDDSPYRIGGFAPTNFDGGFQGPLSARTALIRSRNVPAVRLASRLPSPGFFGFLDQARVPMPGGEEHYGLAPVLGGSEITMEKLLELYAALADGGRLRPLITRRDAAPVDSEPVQLFSSEAAFLVLDILRSVPRPGARLEGAWIRGNIPVAWKTGTSPGTRDAWSIGVFGPYALAVWVGEFDGRPHPLFIGREAAAPIFFTIADALRSRAVSAGVDPTAPVDRLSLASVQVCPVSGRLPGAHCPRRLSGWFIPGRSPIESCSVHRAQGEVWPSHVADRLAAAGLTRKKPSFPQRRGPREHPPRLLGPEPGVVFAARVINGSVAEIPLEATADGAAKRLFWFINGRFLGSSEPGRGPSWKAAPGVWTVRVVDDRGGAAARRVRVEAAP